MATPPDPTGQDRTRREESELLARIGPAEYAQRLERMRSKLRSQDVVSRFRRQELRRKIRAAEWVTSENCR